VDSGTNLEESAGGGDRRRWAGAWASGWITLAILLLWAGAVVLSLLVSIRTGEDVATCIFRRVTGVPCATCGGTRVVYALSRGDVWTAMELNPLVASLVVAGPLVVGWVAWKSWTGRGAALMSWRGQRVGLVIFLVLLGLNWVYVAWPGSLARRPTASLAERWREKNAGVDGTGGVTAPREMRDLEDVE
jgi:ABC-type glycerol-3-phosphate transport system permease component